MWKLQLKDLIFWVRSHRHFSDDSSRSVHAPWGNGDTVLCKSYSVSWGAVQIQTQHSFKMVDTSMERRNLWCSGKSLRDRWTTPVGPEKTLEPAKPRKLMFALHPSQLTHAKSVFHLLKSIWFEANESFSALIAWNIWELVYSSYKFSNYWSKRARRVITVNMRLIELYVQQRKLCNTVLRILLSNVKP